MPRYGVCALLPICWALAGVPRSFADAPDPPAEMHSMYFEHLTVRDGLSQSTVMSILQDSQGYLWLATESGLNRYDGYSIREYRRARGATNGLANDYIWSIAEDREGDLWLATWGGGVARWDRETDSFHHYRHDRLDAASLANDKIRTLLIDAQGRVWAGSEAGLDVLDPQTGRVRHFRNREGDPRSLSSDGVFALHTDSRGRFWIGTDGGLNLYERATEDFRQYDIRARVRAIREDRTGMLWIGTLDSGLLRLDPETGKVTQYRHDPAVEGSLSNDRVMALLEDDAQRLWIATADGLNLFDRASERFIRYGRDPDNQQSLRNDDIMSLHQDRGGVLWVGTRAGGASHWNPRSWALGHHLTPLFHNVAVNAFAENGRGTLWVGTSAGLVEVDKASRRERRFTRETKPFPLPDDRVMALLYDRRNSQLWIGTMAGGLVSYDPARAVARRFRYIDSDEKSLPSDGIMALYQDRAGNIWVGTYGNYVARFDAATGTFKRYPTDVPGRTGFSNSASAIAEDAHGNFWIGTIGGGLDLLDPRTGAFHHFRRREGDPLSLSDDTIYSLHVDASQGLWVGTGGGGIDHVVGSSANPEQVRFEGAPGLEEMRSQVVYGIESDGQGRLWLSTNNGLVRSDPRTRAMKVFHDAHGLQAEEFNFNAHYRGADGTLYFGGNNGFNAFRPDAEPAAAPPPRVVLTSTTVLDRALEPRNLPGPSRPLHLAHHDKLVTFAFSALDFTAPSNNQYLFRLEGFDAGWNDAGARRSATYTNLDAGKYVFRVRAANADGVWNEEGLAIPVIVAAAPWATPVAKALYAATFLIAVAYLWHLHRRRRERELRYSRELEDMVHVRTRELEERNAQLVVLSRAKSDFVARMSHELRTPMNAVLGMSELLLDMHLPAAQRRFVEGIHRSADSLLGIVDDVLDFSKIEAGRLQLAPVECDLVELIEQTAEMLAARAAAKAVEVICDSPTHQLPKVFADSVRLRQVLVNLGGNAVKFTEQGAVTLRLAAQGVAEGTLRVHIEVCDTGIGIEQHSQSKIFEEFCQEDASTTRRFGGTGLGLAIVRQLIELMGGTLSLASVPGAGSTFSFDLILPLVDPAAQIPPPPADLRGVRILAAAGNPHVIALMEKAFASWGADAVCVSTLEAAVQELRSAPYNTVVIDDSSSHFDAATALTPVLALRAARPRVIRVRSFVTLNASETDVEPWYEIELTRPLRLMDLHAAIAGQTADGRSVSAVVEPHLRTFVPLEGRVLIVEDQELNREVAEGMLKSFGLEVDCAEHGREALDKLAANRYDLVLMDCQMPVMDGYSATRGLRRLEGPSHHTPVVALTADMTTAGRLACADAGMDDYVGKPFSRAVLHTVLSRWLAARTVSPTELASCP